MRHAFYYIVARLVWALCSTLSGSGYVDNGSDGESLVIFRPPPRWYEEEAAT